MGRALHDDDLIVSTKVYAIVVVAWMAVSASMVVVIRFNNITKYNLLK